MALFLSLVFAAGCTMFGELWSWVVENYRVGNDHMSYRAQRLPWARHRAGLFAGALIGFLGCRRRRGAQDEDEPFDAGRSSSLAARSRRGPMVIRLLPAGAQLTSRRGQRPGSVSSATCRLAGTNPERGGRRCPTIGCVSCVTHSVLLRSPGIFSSSRERGASKGALLDHRAFQTVWRIPVPKPKDGG